MSSDERAENRLADARATLATAVLMGLTEDRRSCSGDELEQMAKDVVQRILDPSVRWALRRCTRFSICG